MPLKSKQKKPITATRLPRGPVTPEGFKVYSKAFTESSGKAWGGKTGDAEKALRVYKGKKRIAATAKKAVKRATSPKKKK